MNEALSPGALSTLLPADARTHNGWRRTVSDETYRSFMP